MFLSDFLISLRKWLTRCTHRCRLCVCVCGCRPTACNSSTELPGTETHLGCGFSSEEARGGASFRPAPRMAHIFTSLSELLSGLSLAGGLAASPFLQATQIATNRRHQRDYPMALAADSHYISICRCVFECANQNAARLLSVECVWA